MPTALRPRLDCVVVLNGETHEVSTNLRDTLELKKQFKNLTGDAEDAAKLAYYACVRANVFVGTWEEFADACEDIEINEPPPLARPSVSQDS